MPYYPPSNPISAGVVTFAATDTAVVVTHNLPFTPASSDIMLTPITSLAATEQFWVDTLTSTTFTVRVNVAPGQPAHHSPGTP